MSEKTAANRWLNWAEKDLVAAEETFKNPRVAHEITAFHAQQAAEKYVKGFLIYHQKEFPRTHDLVRLAELAGEIDSNVLDLLRLLDDLTDYAVDPRYPDTAASVTTEDARRAIVHAKHVKETVRKSLYQ